jgi:pSer/pThr/pTyr-binding forkhead associated (FHA) protein
MSERGTAERRPVLVVFYPGRTISRIDLERLPLTFGRGDEADVQYDDPRLSRQHFRIRATSSGYLVEDLGSSNGTFLNGVQVTAAVPLHDGDQITVHDITFMFQLQDR